MTVFTSEGAIKHSKFAHFDRFSSPLPAASSLTELISRPTLALRSANHTIIPGEISWRAAAKRPLSVVENAGFGIVSARPIGMAGDYVSHSHLSLFK